MLRSACRIGFVLLWALVAWCIAQKAVAQPNAEIVRIWGSVRDSQTSLPIPGATITVLPFRQVAEEVDGSEDGQFEARLPRSESFTVMAQAPGYVKPEVGPASDLHRLSETQSELHVDITLAKASEISGVVIDENTREPVSRVAVRALWQYFQNGVASEMSPLSQMSGDDGRFVLGGLRPGDYVLEFAPNKPVIQQGEDEGEPFISSGRGYLFWPGLTRDQPNWYQALTIAPGSVMDLGEVRISSETLYALDVSLDALECHEGDIITAQLSRSTSGGRSPIIRQQVLCRSFRIINVPRGEYELEIMRGGASYQGRIAEYGSQALLIDRNVSTTFVPAIEINLNGQVVLDGSREQEVAEPVMRMPVLFSPITKDPFLNEIASRQDLNGKFSVNGYMGHTYDLTLPAPPGFYVKQVLYNGVPVADSHRFQFQSGVPSHALRIVLSKKPATLVLSAEPLRADDSTAWSIVALRRDLRDPARLRERIEIPMTKDQVVTRELTPGDYYVFALPVSMLPALNRPGIVDRLTPKALEVSLVEGGVASISAPLIESVYLDR